MRHKNNYINIFFITLGWLFAWAINYLYHPLMLRFLSIENFGTFATLMGITNLLGVLLWWISMYFNKTFSSNRDNLHLIKSIFYKSLFPLLTLWVLLFIVYIFSAPYISSSLGIPVYLVVLSGVGIIISFCWALLDATLKGLKYFFILPLNSIIWAILKLILGVVLVSYWLWIFWAVLWVVASSFLLNVGTFLYIIFAFTKVSNSHKDVPFSISFKKELLNFFLASLFFSILFNGDIILVKYLYPEKMAGIYGWVSVLWKFLVFVLLSIDTVYYSNIMEYQKEKLPFELLRNPFILFFLTSLLAICFNLIFWHTLLQLLKSEIAQYTHFFLLSLVYYSFIVIINFCSKILIWWKCYYSNILLWVGISSIFFTQIAIWWRDIYNFLYILIWWSFILSLCIWGLLIYEYLFNKKGN